jgi:hypothetical protein
MEGADAEMHDPNPERSGVNPRAYIRRQGRQRVQAEATRQSRRLISRSDHRPELRSSAGHLPC